MKSILFILTVSILLSACGGGVSSEATESVVEAGATGTEVNTNAAPPVIARIHTGNNAELMNELETTRAQLLNSIQNLNQEQWVYTENENMWSIAQIAEHLVSAERLFRMLIDNYVIEGVANEASARNQIQSDEEVLEFVRDRSKPIPIPSKLEPSGVYKTAEQGVTSFEKERDLTILYLRDLDVNLRGFAQPFPGTTLKPMDAHQWFLYISGHTSRLLGQVAQVKADNGYPF